MDSLVADLRALADDLAAQEAFWHHKHPTAYEEGRRDAYDHSESMVRDLIAGHEAEPDVSERDELARLIRMVIVPPDSRPWDRLSEGVRDNWRSDADAILAAGWCKR